MKNVIFILSDQHNAKVLGFQNHPQIKTPNLDRLAKQSVSFNNTICQSPICTPSRMSWISGQYCHNHGYYGLSGENPGGLPTVFGHFRNHGYKTAAIGKIHCPEYWVEDDCDTFMEVRGCSIAQSSEYKKFINDNNLEIISDENTIKQSGYCGQGQCVDGMPSQIDYAHSQEKFIVNSSVEFMKQNADKGKPFFLHTSFGKPHQPYIPAKEFWDLYPEETLQLPPNIGYDNITKAPHFKRQQELWQTDKSWLTIEPKEFDAGLRRKLRGYYGCISQVDHAIGELLDFLETSGLMENTIVIYSSDHGDFAAEHGMLEKAPGICSDAICRVPLIIKEPSATQNNVFVNQVVETVDMIPTVCKLVGIENLETADGEDVSNLLFVSEKETASEKIGLTEFAWSKSVRKGKYRYVYYPKKMFEEEYPNGFAELYDLEADPWEMNNLFFDEQYKEIVVELKEDLFEKLITSTRVKTCVRVNLKTTEQRKTRYENTFNFDGKFSILNLKDDEKLKVPAMEMCL